MGVPGSHRALEGKSKGRLGVLGTFGNSFKQTEKNVKLN